MDENFSFWNLFRMQKPEDKNAAEPTQIQNVAGGETVAPAKANDASASPGTSNSNIPETNSTLNESPDRENRSDTPNVDPNKTTSKPKLIRQDAVDLDD